MGPGESVGSPSPLAWQPAVTGDLPGLVVGLGRAGRWLLGDGREPYRLPSGDEDGSAALVRPCRRRGWRGIGRLTPVVAASREAAHLAKVERQTADQVAALRTIGRRANSRSPIAV